MKQKISIAIVTRNREDKLRRCLESISRQSLSPYKVIVVDNDKKGSAEKVALSFEESINIDYEVEPRQGVAHARNRALLICTTPFLGFVDDDCVLDKKWVEVGSNSISKTKAAYVLGESRLFNPGSIVALAQYYHQDYWFNQKFKKKKNRLEPSSLDTKNIIFKVSEQKRKNLKFDAQFSIHGIDSSDTDFGFQLEEKGLFGVYEPKMIVWHEELKNVIDLLKKAYHRGRLAFLLVTKWNLEDENVNLSHKRWTTYLKSIRFWKEEYSEYTGRHKENTLKKILSFLLIKAYERTYLKGFIGQPKKKGVNLNSDW